MNIGAGCHPNKVKVSGPGVAKTGLKAFDPTYFTVDCAEAGQGKNSNSKRTRCKLIFSCLFGANKLSVVFVICLSR